jgi:DNA polymerase-1
VRPGNDLQIVAFDYAGIQARNVAMESKDTALVKAFWERYDIHKDWMERIEKVSPGWIPKGADKDTLKAYRHRAKNEMVFPSFFGAIPKSLAGYLGIDERKAEQLHEQFWHMFPDIKAWHNRIKRDYYKHGYVTGLSGFRRRAPISPNEIINSPIQADESVIVMDAMAYLSRLGDPRYQATLMVHDDLTFIWPKHEIDNNAEVVIAAMLNSPFSWINVPIGIEMKVGDDWSSVKEVGAYYSDEWHGSDPNAGAWVDGTGWASHNGMEKAKG